MSSLCSLPRELRFYLFDWFEHQDQKNIVLCNRSCYEDMNMVIYNEIRVERKYLIHDISNKLQHFKHATKLTVGDEFEGLWDEQTDYEKFNFALLINSCCSDRLKMITFDIIHLVPDALRFVSEKLQNIECLRLAHVEINGLPWGALSSLHSLKRIHLKSIYLTEDDVKSICEATPKLQGLDIERDGNSFIEYPDYHPYLQLIAGLSDLKLLCVGSNEVAAGSSDYDVLAKLQDLEHLDVSYSRVCDTFIAKMVRSSPKINFLGIEGTKVSDRGVSSISMLQYLRHLNLKYCNITDNALRHVSRMVTLKTLILCRCKEVTDNGLLHLPNLIVLENLNLNECCNITDIGISYLSVITTLRKLKVEKCTELTDHALSHIGKLPFLGNLKLSYNKNYTEDGLLHLVRLRFLHSVDFMACEGITEAGMIRAGLDPKIAVL